MDDEISFSFAWNDQLFSDKELRICFSETCLGNSCASNHEKLAINSLLLSAHSIYFKNLFSNGMKESSLQEILICLPEKSIFPIFQNMIHFTYTNQFPSLNYKELIQTLILADRFLMKKIFSLTLGELLKEPLTVSKCDTMLADLQIFCGHPEMKHVFSIIHEKLKEEFESFELRFQSENFYQLNVESLKVIFSSNKLKISSENISK